MDNQELKESIVTNAYNKAIEMFDIDINIEKIENLLL